MSLGIGWHHPIDDSDQFEGFNDPGIETFAGNPIQNLAREMHQNALDAAAAATVKVEIKLHEVDVASVPGVEDLRENLKACRKASEAEDGDKARTFFTNALKALSNPKIAVLEVSDYNTKGMAGPCVIGTPYYAFVKASGQSKKGSDTAIGSYGIGKFAPYAASRLRTVFVSTVYKDRVGQFQQLTQGKAILMGHDIGADRKHATGFWGVKEKCKPVVGVRNDILPSWVQRVGCEQDLPTFSGSKLSILGFEAMGNWREQLAASVAENFFAAICAGKLIVEVDNYYTLNQTTIVDFLGDDTVREAVRRLEGEPDQFDFSRFYATAYQEGFGIVVEESEQQHLGHCKLHIMVGENLPKKVCVLRDGMFITDSLNRLKSFADFKDFVAVFHCRADKGNELLRAMEPPRHDKFEPERLSTKEDKRKGARALTDMAAWIKDCLKKHARDPVSEVTEIDELRDFFGDEKESGGSNGMEEVNPDGEIKIHAKPIRTRAAASRFEEGGNDTGEDAEGEGGGGNDGAGGGDGTGGNGSATGGHGGGLQYRLVDINNVRSIPTSAKRRRISFTPITSGKLTVALQEAGADADYDISVTSTSVGSLKNGGIVLDAEAGTRITLDLELAEPFNGAVKVVVREIR